MDWDSDDFVIGCLFGIFLVIIASIDLILVWQFTPWLDALSFTPWLLLVPVIMISLVLAILSGWRENFGIGLAVIAFIFSIPPLTLTLPAWGPAYLVYDTYTKRRKRQEKQQREKETYKKMCSVLEQLGDREKMKGGQRSFEEELWQNLGSLPERELVEMFTQIAEVGLPWGIDQVLRALFWDGWDTEEVKKVQKASQTVLMERLVQPDKIFAELSQLVSHADWNKALGKVAQAFEPGEVRDICHVYTLLQAAPNICIPRDFTGLLGFLSESSSVWPDEWMSEIIPRWPGWEAMPKSAREARRWLHWHEEQDIELPSESERIMSIQNIAIRVLCNATKLSHGEERYLAYSLINDLERVRFERDMIAMVDRGRELFTIPGDNLLNPQLVNKLQDLIQVCSLLYRSERSGLIVTDRLAFYASALGVLQSISQAFERDIVSPDQWFLRRIVERWLEIITRGIAEIQADAELEMELTETELVGPYYMVHLKLHNRGGGLGEMVRVRFDPDRQLETEGVRAHNGAAKIEFIRGGQSTRVSFRLSVDHPGTFRLPFRVEYNDLEKEGKVRSFADEVSFAVKKRSFMPLEPNPYIAGPPLKTKKMFFGREDVFRYVEKNLPAGEQQNIIVLHGERRTGKTSILYQLRQQLHESFIPILIDLQGAPSMTADAFWHYIALRMYYELQESDYSIEKPELGAFSKDPFNQFRYDFLKQVYEAVQNKRPVLLIDEFDVLENEVRAKNLPQSIFGNLRHLMQHTSLRFIFAGTYDITKVGSDYWSVLFNLVRWKHIELLDRETFEELVHDPVKGYFEYDDYALDRIWQMTSGHPFFVQLLCYELVNYGNENCLIYFTVQDVNNVIEDVIDVGGKIHLGYMWDGLSLEKKQFLIIVSELLETKGIAVLSDIRAALENYGITINIEDALNVLKGKAILYENEGRYDFPIGLVRKWIYETKSLESLL